MRRSKPCSREPRVYGIVAFVMTAALGSAAGQDGSLTVSPLFSNHAVLQRDMPIRFWGTSDPGTTVSGTFAGSEFSTTADDDGHWETVIGPKAAGGPFVLYVHSGDDSIRSNNILVGDVWLCSGQSNMGWRLEQSDRGAEFIESASSDGLRMLQANRRTSHEPIDTVDSRGWRTDAPAYVARFSAVGYHFGRLLHEQTGVPIGLIESTWGGTPAEAWTPEPTLRANTDWAQPLLDTLPDYDVPPEELQAQVDAFERQHADYIARVLEAEQGLPAGWHTPEHVDADWTDITAPGFWEPVIGSVDGIVWLRKTVVLTEAQAEAGATLHLGMIEEYDDTFVNGTRVGGMNYPSPGAGRREREYPIEPGVLRPGPNTIAVRAVDTRTAGGFGSPPGAMRLRTRAGDVSLDGSWKLRVSHDARDDGGFPLEGTRMVTAARQQRRPAALYNGMIEPFTRLPIKGVIWYQGESNNGRAEQYAEMFPAMIQSWRNAWRATGATDDDFPFLFVQLPNYRVRSPEPEESGWAELREAQEAALDLPATGMAVTIELGQADDIHPRNKLPVAERLAAIALNDVYARPDPLAHSPRMATCTMGADGSVLVRFSGVQKLTTIDGEPPKGFALAGSDGILRWAQAEIVSDGIRVSRRDIAAPTEIRYAWAWNPELNTTNAGGRPLAPFRETLADH